MGGQREWADAATASLLYYSPLEAMKQKGVTVVLPQPGNQHFSSFMKTCHGVKISVRGKGRSGDGGAPRMPGFRDRKAGTLHGAPTCTCCRPTTTFGSLSPGEGQRPGAGPTGRCGKPPHRTPGFPPALCGHGHCQHQPWRQRARSRPLPALPHPTRGPYWQILTRSQLARSRWGVRGRPPSRGEQDPRGRDWG